MMVILFATALLTSVHALPALTKCSAGGRAGRYGLCDASTGNAIILRGSNYIRLGGDPPNIATYHSTFDAGVYNRTRYRSAFQAMQHDGYNINRVFMDELPNRGIGGATTSTLPLDPAWLDRLAQYISDAEQHNIYTVITLVYTPQNTYWHNYSKQFPPRGVEWANSWNAAFLTVDGQAAFTQYASLLAAGLKSRLSTGVQQNAVVVSLQNEFFLRGDQYPFSSHNTSLTLGNGIKYDMSSASDRQQAADANTNLWAKNARAKIRASLPTTLVTVGVFTFHAVQKNGPNGLLRPDGSACISVKGKVDCRFPARPYWLAEAGMDFLDVHIYQPNGSPAALAANLATEEWAKIEPHTPIMMGEFGCNEEWGLNATTCAPMLKTLQRSSCAQGFSGWMFWTYDCDEQPEPHWFTLMEADGAIDNVLSPLRNPDPCSSSLA